MLNADTEGLPILTTKLYRPPVTPDLEQRTRLLERLESRRQRPLTLISAPAGYGKTMLASMWLEVYGGTSGWVSLDEHDNDLQTFVSYLLAALRKVFPTLQLKTADLLDAPNIPSLPILTRYLLNDLDQIQEPFILVLDDTQNIQKPAIYQLLDELLRHPPPSMHLVLIGRHDPPLQLVSLRARGQVTEIRAQELRFTAQETGELLSSMLGRQVDEAVAADWAHITEGWVTAIRLAALSLRHRGRVDDLQVRNWADSRYLNDYLLGEVLARLPAASQAWLLKSALLDRFCASLIEAVLWKDGDPEGLTGKDFISWLEHENLFLVPLDDRGEWFRFHHLFQQLLLEMLQRQVNPGEITELRMRASQWFAENSLLDEALRYALASGNVESAILLVEQYRYVLMNIGQWRRLERWLGLFPASAVAQAPILLTTKAFLGVYFGQDKHILNLLNERKHLLRRFLPGTAELQFLQAEIDAVQALVDMVYGRTTSAKASARRSLDGLPSHALYPRALATLSMAICLQMEGELSHCVTLIQDVLDDNTWPAEFQTQLVFYLSIAYYQQGDLNGVLRTTSEYMQLADQYHLDELLCYGWYNLGVAHYLRNEFAQAEPDLLALLEDRALSAPSYLVPGIFALVLIYHATGRESEANQVIDLLSTHLQEAKDTFGWVISEAVQVELALRQNNLEQARRLSFDVNFDIRPPYWLFYVPQLTRIKLLLAEGSAEHLEEAHVRLDDLDEAMRVINRNNVRIDVLNLHALLWAVRGDEPIALEKLRAALELGVLGGNIRSFVDLGTPMASLLKRFKRQQSSREYAGYLDQILAAFPEASRSPALALQSKLDEPLTDRELEVIALLAQRLSNKEIAAKLVISPRTIKRHTLNIYRKLDVNSRQQAVEKAAELGILAKTR